MNKFSLLPIMRALAEGRVIRKVLTLIMQAFAIASLLFGVYLIVQLIRGMSGAPTESVIAGIIAIILLAAMCFFVAQIFWLRASHTRDLAEGPYNLIPLGSIFIRAIGESYAAVYALMGVLGCLFLWITKANPWEAAAPSFVPAMTDQNPFFAGILFLVRCMLGSGLALLIGYFLAEVTLMTLDLVVHMRLTAGQNPTETSQYVGIPHYPAPPPAPQFAPPMPQYAGAPQYPGAPPYPEAQQYPGQPPPQYPPQPAPQYQPPAPPQYGPPPAQQYPPSTQYPQQPPAAGARCPTCGADVTPGAPYCGRCGNPLPGRTQGY